MMMTSQSIHPYLDMPDGFDVPGLPTLLDAEAMRERFNHLLPNGVPSFESCRISNLRQKTRTTSTICYEMVRSSNGGASKQLAYARAFAREEYGDALRRVGLSRWASTDEGLSITPLHDLSAIAYWFPNDERLDGLRRVVVPKKLQRLLYAHCSEYPAASWRVSDRSIRLQIIRYKPERRAVIRCRFRAQEIDGSERHERFVYLGLYERERLEGLAVNIARIRELAKDAQHWTTASLIGIDEDDALVIWDELRGKPLRDLLSTNDWEPAIDSCARAIAEMHEADGSTLPSRESIESQLADVSAYLLNTLPECHELITGIARRLAQSETLSKSEHRSIVHGDLHPGQLIIDGAQVGIIDFDRARCGNPMEDLGNLRAQLWLGPPGERGYESDVVFDRFLAAYTHARAIDTPPGALEEWTAFSVFRSAAVPLGRFEPNWRQRARNILHESKSLLS